MLRLVSCFHFFYCWMPGVVVVSCKIDSFGVSLFQISEIEAEHREKEHQLRKGALDDDRVQNLERTVRDKERVSTSVTVMFKYRCVNDKFEIKFWKKRWNPFAKDGWQSMICITLITRETLNLLFSAFVPKFEFRSLELDFFKTSDYHFNWPFYYRI